MDKNTPVNSSRRRILSGSAAAPVVLTLTSMPVTAGTCTTASASTSMSPSGQARAQKFDTCDGLSPSDWVAESVWPSLDDDPSNNDKDNEFNDYFEPGLSDSPSLLTVLGLGNTDLAAACLATYLNVKAGHVDPAMFGDHFSAQQIWKEAQTGTFTVSANLTPWTPDQVVAWLAKTWTSQSVALE